LFGTQFHPEKSDKIGLKIIDNFINLDEWNPLKINGTFRLPMK
jgi:GMP synthase-like glutamine amidotransferase